MGKKLKLNLDDLKVSSFVTSINGLRGGLEPTNTCGATGEVCIPGITDAGCLSQGASTVTKPNTTLPGGKAITGDPAQCC
jgi:hypothetical protein